MEIHTQKKNYDVKDYRETEREDCKVLVCNLKAYHDT